MRARGTLQRSFVAFSSLPLILGVLAASPSAEALSPHAQSPMVKVAAPFTNLYASDGSDLAGNAAHLISSPPSIAKRLVTLSTIKVTYVGVPIAEQEAIQAALTIWSQSWSSSISVNVVANYGPADSADILASASPVDFFQNFKSAPDPTLYYSSAMANAIAKKDLDPANPEITININSIRASSFYLGTDGNCPTNQYDLESIIVHEMAHGLGFLSTETYDPFFGYGAIDQPTPYDAYAQTPDGGRLMDLPSPSLALGRALRTTLLWSGKNGLAANGGVEKPKLYTPSPYERGSSISHLDQKAFADHGPDALMTPSWSAGAVFHQPGPLVLAMLNDMRVKPPAGILAGVPNAPQNVFAIVGDRSAIVSFTPPDNARSSPVESYAIKVNETGSIITSTSSPVTVYGLANGSHYSFTVSASNALGSSAGAISNVIYPQWQWRSTVLDAAADAKNVATTTFRGNPVVAYSDSKNGDLKIAFWNGKSWTKTILDGNSTLGGRTTADVSGNISICTSSNGPQQRLNIFYGDLKNKLLRYAGFDGKKWTFSIVDGNGTELNKYTDLNRVRTSSDVSGPSACVDTKDGLQVFYRDQSQGIILGAVKNVNGWNYELVDGDRATDGRTTGDVGFHIKATNSDKNVYLLYDSISQVNKKKKAIAGEVRLATRASTHPEDWKYTILDSPSTDTAVAGYDVAISNSSSVIRASWMVAEALTIPNPDQLRWVDVTNSGTVDSASTNIYGTPSAPLASDGEHLLFNCQNRLCALNTSDHTVSLVTSSDLSDSESASWIVINKVRYALIGVGGKLLLFRN